MAKFEGFDDCAICLAMMAAEERGRALSESELKEVSKKQKEAGLDMVGFEEEFQ